MITIRQKYIPDAKILDAYGSKFEPKYLSLFERNGLQKTALPRAQFIDRVFIVRAHASLSNNAPVKMAADHFIFGFSKGAITSN